MQNEIWRPVRGYERFYEASNLGRIRSLHRRAYQRIRKTFTTKGYERIVLDMGGKGMRRTTFVHSLITEAFLGPRPPGYCCNHKNANKLDNRIGNLEYVLPGVNHRHAAKLGLYPAGERHHAVTIPDSEIEAIRASTERLEVVAARYGVDRTTIWRIRTKRSRHFKWSETEGSLNKLN